jgi:hypothetical protein
MSLNLFVFAQLSDQSNKHRVSIPRDLKKPEVPGIRKIVAGAYHLGFICPGGLGVSGVFVFGLRQTSILVLFYFMNKSKEKLFCGASQ